MKRVILAAAVAALSFVGYGSSTYQSTITVSGYAGSETLTDFPVLVRVSPTTVKGFSYADCEPDGSDIRFFAADGTTVLAHEIDTWNPEGDSLVWVKLPALAANTTFDLSYGDPSAATASGNVWAASGYEGVWHLGEANGTAANASTNDWFGGTPSGAGAANMVGETGRVGTGRCLGTSAKLSYMAFADYVNKLPITTTFTFSGWYYVSAQSGTSKYTRLVAHSENGSSNGWGVQLSNGPDGLRLYDGNSGKVDAALSSFLNRWAYLSFVFADTTATVYVDGVEVASDAINGAKQTAGYALSVGNSTGVQNGWFSGTLDEVRFSSVARSADWTKAEYDTVNAADFLSCATVVPPTEELTLRKELRVASSAFGSSAVAARVLGIGADAASATLMFAYGSTPDAADGEVEVPVAGPGEWRGTIPHLACGVTYYVKATLSNDVNEVVTSDVFTFVQPEVMEPGNGSSASYFTTGLVAQWDGIDNVIADGKATHSTTPDKWYDLSGNGNDATFSSLSKLVWEDDGWTNDNDSRPAYAPSAAISAMADKEFTVEFLVKPATTTTRRTFLGQYSAADFGIEHNSSSKSDGGIRLYYGNPDIYAPASDIKVCQDVVSSVAYTTSGGEHKLYLNGAHVFTKTGSAIPNGRPNSGQQMVIGGEPSRGGMSFRGKFYTMRIYDRALSADEVARNYRVDAARYCGVGNVLLPLTLESGRLVLTASASGASRTAYLFADETYGGVDGWGEPVETVTLPAGATSVSFATPEGWGKSVWFARAQVADTGREIWSATVVAADADLPSTTLADARAIGTDKLVLSGSLNSFVGGSCTLTPVVTDSSGAAIDFLSESLTLDAPGEFAFTLAGAGLPAEGETYTVCVEAKAGGKASRSVTRTLVVGTAGALTPLDPGAEAPVEVAVESRPGSLTTVSPVYGRYAAAENKVYSFSAPTSATADGRVYSLAGYEVYDEGGDEPVVSGTNNVFTFATDRGGFRVVWKWNVLYATELTVLGGHGTAVAQQSAVAHGGTAQFTASPETGYAVVWSGDVPNEKIFGNELVLESVEGPLNVTATFFVPSPTEGPETGLFADYTNAVSVTFAGYEGVETLKEFTALIRLSEGKGGFSYNDCAFTDGRDVRFCDATGNELASEIVTWNPNGTSEVWVKVPELAGRKTRIFMVWGNENATARPQTMCAWDCATIGAWGLEDTKGAVLDGSLKGHHGVCNPAVVTSVKGVVGSARRFNGTEYATIGVRDAWTLEPSNLTASCWFRYDTLPGNKGTGLFTSTRLNNNGGQGCALLLNADGCVHGTHNGYTFSNSVKTEKPVSAGEWHQAVLTTSIPATGNASSQLFVDGRFVAAYSRAFSGNPVWWGVFGVASAFPVIGGSYVNETKYYFNGDVDETQLAAEVRSADWIRASYLTVASNDTFSVFGADDTSFTVTGDEVLPVAAGLVPAAGRGLLAPQIEATAPASYVQGGTRWTATGWAVVADGKKIAAGEGNSVSCAWPAGAKAVAVNWSWTKEHRISVDGVSTWVADGGVFKVTAPAAQTDKAFHSWEGDCPETETFSDAFDLGVDGPKTLTSVFADRTYVEGGDTQGLVDAVAAVKDKAEPHVIVLGDGAFGPAATCTATGPLVIRSANGTGSTTVTNVSLTCFSMNNRRAAFKDLTFVMRKVGGNGAKLATGIFNLVDCVVEGDGDMSAPDDRRAFYLTSNGIVCRTVFRNLCCGGNILATQYRVLVDSCVFTNNHVSAAPVAQSYRGLVVRNSVFADNVPLNNNRHDGGAVTFNNTETLGQMVENCTFVDNRNNATTTYGDNSRGGAVRVKSPTLVLNTLFSGNAAGSDVDGNDFYGLVAGVCSLSAQFGEEGFADSAAVRCLTGEPAFVEDDPLYRVTSLSPARNAGLATLAARDAAARDIAGTNRVNEGAIDIGASEFYDSGDEEFAVLVEADVASGRDTLTVGFTAKVGGAKGEVTYAWDFGDGEMSDGPNPSHTYAKPGYYTLTLTVTDGTTHETATFTRESFIKILPSTCYVNAAGSHEDPYATPETGAASILDVIALTPSKIVICANSTSDKKNDGTLCKIEFPVEVIGEDPATSVLADRVHLNHASAVLRDLTCTVTSKGDSSGLGPFQVTGGLVSNVTFTGCTPSPNSNSSREVLKLFEGGRVVDSRFVRNNITAKGQRMDTTPGNVAIGICGKGALVDRCVVTNNFGGTEKGAFAAGIRVDGNYSPAPVIRNTLIADNQCFGPYPTNTVGGAGIYAKGSVVVESCTIATNRTSGAGAAIYVTAGTAEFVNTIVAANVGGLTNAAETCSNEVFVASGAAATWTNCRVPAEAGVSGEGVTTAEPKFNLGVRRSEPYWALRGTSPCKNKGVSLDWMGGESDLSGKPRVFEKKPDLGCYENQIGGTVIIVR